MYNPPQIGKLYKYVGSPTRRVFYETREKLERVEYSLPPVFIKPEDIMVVLTQHEHDVESNVYVVEILLSDRVVWMRYDAFEWQRI